MAMVDPHFVVPTVACRHCGTVGPAAVCVYPDDGGPLLAFCPACARDPERLRALIRALGLGPVRLVPGRGAADPGGRPVI